MRILLIEDDLALCQALTTILHHAGHEVSCLHDGVEGLLALERGAADVVVLDRMLPGMDGVSLLRRAREKGVDTPVLMLTALDQLEDRVSGLNAGADDYLAKPFAPPELLARLAALGRRPAAYRPALVQAGDLTLDPVGGTLTGPCGSCQLSRRENALLSCFLSSLGQTLPRGLLFDRVWGLEADVEEGSLDSFVYLVRRRLRTVGSKLLIRTVRGVGYMAQMPC